MHVPSIARWWHHFHAWWHDHRPLHWMDFGSDELKTWRPDPPVMERLIR